MENLSLKEFAAALSGKEPVPGGGGASACTGSYGCALGMMACALTHGKKKYACYEQDIKRIEGELAVCRDTLLSCINEDAQGFLPLSKAYGLPKDEILEKALHQASLTPMKILKNSAYAMTLLDELSGKCSKLILSDVVTGAALLAASANGGFINVGANTGMMKNTEIAQKLNEEAKMLLSQTMKLHDSISQLMS